MKKVISAFLAFAMVVAVTSCDRKSSAAVTKDSVIEFAEDFGKAINSEKTKSFTKLCVDPDDDLIELFENMTQSASVKGDDELVAEAIFSTFEYEIDEDTICLLKKGATIEMTFSVVDFDRIDMSDCESLEDYIDQLLNSKKSKVFTKELELEAGEDSLLIANAEDILEDIYVWEDLEVDSDAFKTFETEVTNVTEGTEATSETESTTEAVETSATEAVETSATEATELISDSYEAYVSATAFYDLGNLVEDDGYVYENTAYVESNLILKEGYNNLDWDEVYCDVYYNDEYIASYYVLTVEDEYGLAATCGIGVCNEPQLGDEELHYLVEGEYYFEYYDPDDNFIAANYCYVSLEDFGYNFELKEGDSKELNNIIFGDWYFIAPDYLSFEMYNQVFSYSYEYSFKLFDGDDEIFSSKDYYVDPIYGDGVFSSVNIEPQNCGLDVFEKGEYRLDVYDKDGKIIYNSTFTIE